MLRIFYFTVNKKVPESAVLRAVNACMSVSGMQLQDDDHTAVRRIKERLGVKDDPSDEFFVHEGGHHISIHTTNNCVTGLTIRMVDLEDGDLVMDGFPDDLCKERLSIGIPLLGSPNN